MSETSQGLTAEKVVQLLEAVVDPDLGIGIVDLGLVYDIRLEDGQLEVDMTLTSMGCPAGEYLYNEVETVLTQAEGVKSVKVNLVWDPPWGPDRVNPEVRYALDYLY
jgi:metal-sulfur cluster biosynthetic enzyme